MVSLGIKHEVIHLNLNNAGNFEVIMLNSYLIIENTFHFGLFLLSNTASVIICNFVLTYLKHLKDIYCAECIRYNSYCFRDIISNYAYFKNKFSKQM